MAPPCAIYCFTVFCGLSMTRVMAAVLSTGQMSTYNDRVSGLAVDDDVETCAETGMNTGPWWKLDMGERREVTGVSILGSAAAFQIRIGDKSDSLGDRGGFEDNPLCVFSPGHARTAEMTTYWCRRSRSGRYLSIHVVDPAKVTQLRLCQVQVHPE